MAFHAFCRALLATTLAATRQPDPLRAVKVEVDSDSKIGSHHTFWVRVDDHRDPGTGTSIPAGSQPGHFRTGVYEVEACCRYAAKVEALNRHDRRFNGEAQVA